MFTHPRGLLPVPELVRVPFHSLVDGGERVLFFQQVFKLMRDMSSQVQHPPHSLDPDPGDTWAGLLLGRARRCVVTGQVGTVHPRLRKWGDVSLRQRLELVPSLGACPFSHFSKLVFEVWFTHGTVHVCVSVLHWTPVQPAPRSGD